MPAAYFMEEGRKKVAGVVLLQLEYQYPCYDARAENLFSKREKTAHAHTSRLVCVDLYRIRFILV